MDVKNYLISSKKANPIIYAYIAKDGTGKPINEGYIKIGFTSRSDEPTKEKNAILRTLLEDFNKPEIDLKPSKIGNLDVIGNAYEYLIARFAGDSGKKGGEFYDLRI